MQPLVRSSLIFLEPCLLLHSWELEFWPLFQMPVLPGSGGRSTKPWWLCDSYLVQARDRCHYFHGNRKARGLKQRTDAMILPVFSGKNLFFPERTTGSGVTKSGSLRFPSFLVSWTEAAPFLTLVQPTFIMVLCLWSLALNPFPLEYI